ncbi:MAG: hypothetical protein AAF725_15205 [Acidobacteriota bacterium]
MRFRHFAGLVALFLFASSSEAELAPRIARYADAEYTRSYDPLKAVMTLHSRAVMTRGVRTLVIYGDGRTEYQYRDEPIEEGRMSREELDGLFEKAVRHGLAEWDTDTVLAWQLQDRGSPFPTVRDGSKVVIHIALERYSRGSYSAEDATRIIRVTSPEIAARHLPDIPQYKALDDLCRVLWTWSER